MFATAIIKSPVHGESESIIVPKSAVMWTGKRSVVYVKTSTDMGIGFMMREVTLGPSLGESYVIENGLSEGEEIATNGTFSIDAAAQLAGKPSMMSPEGGAVMTGHNHGISKEMDHSEHKIEVRSISITSDAKKTLSSLYASYLDLKDALVVDDLGQAKAQGSTFMDLLKGINTSLFEGEAHNLWLKHSKPAEKSIAELVNATGIAEARKPFQPLSEHMIQLARALNPYEKPLFIQHCPMVDDFNGADWLSTEENIMNPYYGESMLTCGEVKEEIK